MPRRHILTERQRRTLLALPTDEASLLKHYTLAEDDLEHIRQPGTSATPSSRPPGRAAGRRARSA